MSPEIEEKAASSGEQPVAVDVAPIETVSETTPEEAKPSELEPVAAREEASSQVEELIPIQLVAVSEEETTATVEEMSNVVVCFSLSHSRDSS